MTRTEPKRGSPVSSDTISLQNLIERSPVAESASKTLGFLERKRRGKERECYWLFWERGRGRGGKWRKKGGKERKGEREKGDLRVRGVAEGVFSKSRLLFIIKLLLSKSNEPFHHTNRKITVAFFEKRKEEGGGEEEGGRDVC